MPWYYIYQYRPPLTPAIQNKGWIFLSRQPDILYILLMEKMLKKNRTKAKVSD